MRGSRRTAKSDRSKPALAQAREPRLEPGVHVGQPAPKATPKVSHEARRSSEKCVGSHEPHRPNYESPRFAMVRKFSFSFCLVVFWVIFAGHFRARMHVPKKRTNFSPAYISETKPRTAVVPYNHWPRRHKKVSFVGCRGGL